MYCDGFRKLQNAQVGLQRTISELTEAWADIQVNGQMAGRLRFPTADLQLLTADLQRVCKRLDRIIADGIGKEGFSGTV